MRRIALATGLLAFSASVLCAQGNQGGVEHFGGKAGAERNGGNSGGNTGAGGNGGGGPVGAGAKGEANKSDRASTNRSPSGGKVTRLESAPIDVTVDFPQSGGPSKVAPGSSAGTVRGNQVGGNGNGGNRSNGSSGRSTSSSDRGSSSGTSGVADRSGVRVNGASYAVSDAVAVDFIDFAREMGFARLVSRIAAGSTVDQVLKDKAIQAARGNRAVAASRHDKEAERLWADVEKSLKGSP